MAKKLPKRPKANRQYGLTEEEENCLNYYCAFQCSKVDAVKIFLRGSKGFLATVNILFEEGIHILVEASGRDRVSARLTLEKLLNEPECLTSLVE